MGKGCAVVWLSKRRGISDVACRAEKGKSGRKMSRLRAERERMGLTQEATRAILWGMPHRTFQDIESERRQPPEWVMLAILEKLSKRKSLAGQGEKTPDSKRRAKSNSD